MTKPTLFNLWNYVPTTTTFSNIIGLATTVGVSLLGNQYIDRKSNVVHVWTVLGIGIQSGVIVSALTKIWTDYIYPGIRISEKDRVNLYGFLTCCGGYWLVDQLFRNMSCYEKDYEDWEEIEAFGTLMIAILFISLPTIICRDIFVGYMQGCLDEQQKIAIEQSKAVHRDPNKLADSVTAMMAVAFDLYDLHAKLCPKPAPPWSDIITRKKNRKYPPISDFLRIDLGLSYGKEYFDHFKDKPYHERIASLNAISKSLRVKYAKINLILMKEGYEAPKQPKSPEPAEPPEPRKLPKKRKK